MKNISIIVLLLVSIGVIGCASVKDYLVGTPLIGTIANNKQISRVVKEQITLAGSYEVSYFIPPNGLSTPADIALNSLGEIFVSEVRGKGISKISPTGEVSFWANTNNVGSYSLAFDSQDNLYSYFFPGGSIYKITPQGSVSALFENNADLKCYTESSITVDPTTNELYIVRNNEATGYATLYKLVNGTLITLLDNLKYIQVITFSKEGKLFWGTGNEIQELNLSDFSRKTVARPPENQIINHHGLAADDGGNLYAATKTKLYKIDRDGVMRFLVAGFYDLEGLAVASDNTIYAVDRTTCGVCKISESAGQAEYLVPPGFISTPQAMEFTSTGKLVVTEDETGCFGTYSDQGTFEGYTSAIVYMPPLAGISLDNQDNVYISESAPGFNDRLVRFNNNGGAAVISTSLQKPAGLVFYNNELYAAEFDSGQVSKFGSDGNWTIYVKGLTNPESIDFDQHGNLYVSGGASALNETANYIEKIAPDKTISRFATLSGITIIKYDTANDRLLVSAGSGKIHQISPAGISSDFASGFSSPMGIAFDGTGNLYISDDVTNAVYKLKKL